MQEKYLPHRRQRPLSDNTFEYRVLEKSSSGPSATQKLRTSYKIVAAVMGLFTGLATIGMGATVLPWSATTPQVAGVQTNEAFQSNTPQTQVNQIQNTSQQTDITTCWNRVSVFQDDLFWNNTCRGEIVDNNEVCQPIQRNLSTAEEEAYRQWHASDQVLDPACEADPSQIPDKLPPNNPFK